MSNFLERSILIRKRARATKNYELYIQQLYDDMDIQIANLEHQASMFCSSGEDLITTFIVNGLQNMGYGVTHDGNSNGHVDINVNETPFTWFGEAKLQKGNENTYGGFQQLTTRYSRGGKFGYHGGVIIYHQNTTKSARTSLTEWHTYLSKNPDNIGITCKAILERDLHFDSRHLHQDSGDPYLIRHFWINLQFNPKK